MIYNVKDIPKIAAMAQSVERVLGKDEVTSSNLVSSSKKSLERKFEGFLLFTSYFFTITFSFHPVRDFLK